MNLRKLLFWPHLIAGTIAGLVILIMSVSGVLLTYEKQMIAWADERQYSSLGVVEGQLPVYSLLTFAREAQGSTPSVVTLRSDPSVPAQMTFGRQGILYVDRSTGRILGPGSTGLRAFFRTVTDWHRWLGAQTKNRPFARSITGACNLMFLLLILSGMYLWWPKRLTVQHLKPVVLFRGGLSGKARDFNWHNVIGFWCAVPLFLIVLGATVISYPWASNMVYRAAGSEPPKAPAGPPAAGDAKESVPVPLAGLGPAWLLAERQTPGWRSISVRIPGSASAPWVFTIDSGYAGQPQKRGTLTVDRQGERVMKWEPFADLDAGRQWRTWLRFVHTGEYYGLAGQTIAGIASAGAGVLVWTGISLALRRFRSWRTRKAQLSERTEPVLR